MPKKNYKQTEEHKAKVKKHGIIGTKQTEEHIRKRVIKTFNKK